ncbi:substrate binding domain-containing protein, partial [Photobacterium sp. OFAV2-7]|uniref:substrate binding domain-containing protein n=1 Tax=Photobacterium sp. OFAV2-7 TaxID=2917748 RepID=UPI001EF5A166
ELTERVVDLVEENTDVAIRSGRLPDSTMIAKKLLANNFLLCASSEYLAKRGTPDSPQSLSNHQCIRYGYAGWREWYLMEDPINRLDIDGAITVNTVNGQKQLLLNNAGLALMPLWAVQKELQSGELINVLPQHTFSPYEVISSTYAIYLKRELVSPKIRVFIDYMSRHI